AASASDSSSALRVCNSSSWIRSSASALWRCSIFLLMTSCLSANFLHPFDQFLALRLQQSVAVFLDLFLSGRDAGILVGRKCTDADLVQVDLLAGPFDRSVGPPVGQLAHNIEPERTLIHVATF